jgi:hypothetical protein
LWVSGEQEIRGKKTTDDGRQRAGGGQRKTDDGRRETASPGATPRQGGIFPVVFGGFVVYWGVDSDTQGTSLKCLDVCSGEIRLRRGCLAGEGVIYSMKAV